MLEKQLFTCTVPHDESELCAFQVIDEKIQAQNGAFTIKHIFHALSLSFKDNIDGY